MAPTRQGSSLIPGVAARACAIALAGLLLGAGHSWRTPVLFEVDREKLVATDISTLPVVRGGSAPSGAGGAPTQLAAAKSDTPPKPDAAPAQTLGYEITIDQAHALYERGVFFIDARVEHELARGMVDQAIWIPADDIPKHVQKAMHLLPGPVVIYCGGGSCDASHNVAKYLQGAGFTQVHVMTEGFPAWTARAFPTTKHAPTP